MTENIKEQIIKLSIEAEGIRQKEINILEQLAENNEYISVIYLDDQEYAETEGVISLVDSNTFSVKDTDDNIIYFSLHAFNSISYSKKTDTIAIYVDSIFYDLP